MFQGVRRRRRERVVAEVQIAPLIDMVFILLIFFLVTTTFTRETGVDVRRPRAATAIALDDTSLRIGIDPEGRTFVDQRRIDLLALRALVERRVQATPDLAIVIVADESTDTGALIAVMDECRSAGAERIAVASRKE